MVLEAALQSLAGIAVVLGVGLLVSLFAKKIKLASLLLLLITGLVMNYLNSIGVVSFVFSETLVVTIAMLALVLVVFDGSSRFKMKMVSEYSGTSLKMFLSFLILSIVGVGIASSLLFFGKIDLNHFLLASIFAITMAGTDPTSMFHILKNSSNRVIQLLEIESIVNTPFTIILPLMAIQIMANTQASISSVVLGQISPLILQIAAGIGMGVLLGFLLSRILHKFYSKEYSPILLIVFALAGYLLTESIGGSGVLGVATMGLFFGNMYINRKEDLQTFNQVLSTIFVILVFILVGFVVPIDLSILFIFKVVIVFLLSVFLRYISLTFVLPKGKFNNEEKIFMSLMIPKGIAVAVVVLSLALISFPGGEAAVSIIASAIVMSMILSLLVSTVLARFDGFFLKRVHNEEEKLEQEKAKLVKEKALMERLMAKHKKEIEKKLKKTKKEKK